MSVSDKIHDILFPQPPEDPALDLFNPSVEAELAPYLAQASLPPAARPLQQFQGWFKEYFTSGSSIITLKSAAAAASITERDNIALGLMNQCGDPLDTWSIPRPCLRVQGKRGTFKFEFNQLFMGDLLWLFYFERMGIQRMLGAILDDFVSKGRFPIRPQGISGLVLETLVREVKAGLSSTVRDRDTTYRRCLGWTSQAGAKLDNDAPKNTAFNLQFHRLVHLALGYYQEKRLAVAIQASANAGKPSVATLISLREAIGQLRKSFDPFKYGRNHTHTLSGIVWTLAGVDLIHRLRSELGIPTPYDQPEEIIPAAYELLVGKETTLSNRYTSHRDCAVAGRAILLDVQGLDFDSTVSLVDADLEDWLGEIEGMFELYRSAYRALTGTDLGASSTPAVAQAA
jgi:hypothetical protein